MSFRETILFLIRDAIRFVSPMAVATEWAIAALAALLVATAPLLRISWLKGIRNAFRGIAARKRTAVVICGLLPVAVRISMLGVAPVPDPSIHDEFSHLLLADTLAHGRLTNPTHPMWRHFESIHIIQTPTYNSMYPPGQAAFLALGQVVFRDPWAGVVISAGLMFAAACWMMQGWLPPSWALFGTLIAICKFGVAGLWMNSYLSGAVAGIGGALLIGSLPRLRREEARAFEAALLAAGIVVLVNTRPFEGAALGAAAAVYLTPVVRRVPRNRQLIPRLALPMAVVLTAGALFTCYYCWRVTGSPIRLPYQVNRDTYGWPENLAFLPPKRVSFRHQVLADMYTRELHNRAAYESPKAALDNVDIKLFDNWTFFIGPVLSIPLIFLPWAFRDRRTRPLILFVGAIAILNLFQLVLYPYHLGPVVPIMFAIVAQCTRHLYVSIGSFSRRKAMYLAIVLPVAVALVSAMKQVAPDWGIPLAYWEYASEAHRDGRASIAQWLEARPRKQLVLVRYAAGHSPNREWVYNKADIDGSKLIWAREMDSASDTELLRYFSDREAWLLEADVYPLRVVQYPGPPVADDTNPEFTKSARLP